MGVFFGIGRAASFVYTAFEGHIYDVFTAVFLALIIDGAFGFSEGHAATQHAQAYALCAAHKVKGGGLGYIQLRCAVWHDYCRAAYFIVPHGYYGDGIVFGGGGDGFKVSSFRQTLALVMADDA